MSGSSDSSSYWNVNAMSLQLSKDSVVFSNLKTCFTETAAFSERLIQTLAQIKTALAIENPLLADRSKETRKELSLIAGAIQDLIKYVNEELIKSLDDFTLHYEKNYTDLLRS
eukprot:TRINITY_DN13500_c0_g3_i1.p1 TRINITY_DN13500_c0_g3~~TRINITY_DN13500_c0_g3_i1.p1  ORF type:complete len:113 (-),score=10.23 TRINITY_DN13500_c0_g3_i1:105-443(-)